MTRYLRLEDALPLLDEADDALHHTAASFGEIDVTHDSLCQGWTRAQVLAHLVGNAGAMGNLVTWATTGVPTPGYASREQRDADIEELAGQESAHLLTALAQSSSTIRQRLEELVGREDLAQVRSSSTSPPLAGDQIAWARLREVVVHHVDLDAGFSFSDADTSVVTTLLDEAVDRVGSHDGCPGVSLIAADTQRQWDLAGGGQQVRGLPNALLLWLSRGIERDLRHEEPLPELPAWG